MPVQQVYFSEQASRLELEAVAPIAEHCAAVYLPRFGHGLHSMHPEQPEGACVLQVMPVPQVTVAGHEQVEALPLHKSVPNIFGLGQLDVVY